MKLLFVYGSLRKGCGNHCFLENSSYLGNFVTSPEYTMQSMGAFPAVVEGGDTEIVGEVWGVSEPVYEAIERLEGYPSFYNRKPLETPYGQAEMYFVEGHDKYGQRLPVVDSGNWVDFLNENLLNY